MHQISCKRAFSKGLPLRKVMTMTQAGMHPSGVGSGEMRSIIKECYVVLVVCASAAATLADL
jgi:hypothetical protein